MRLGGARWAGLLLGLAVSAAALTLALRWAGWRLLREALLRVDLRFLLLGVAVFVISMMARVACWRALIGRPVGFGRVLAALNEGYLLNNVLPWRMGELGRAILLGRQPGLSTPLILSSIVVERLYDMILAVGLMLVLLPVAAGAVWASRAAWIGAGAVGVALIFVGFALRRPASVEGWVARLPGPKPVWLRLWSSFRDGLAVLQTRRRLALSFGWMAASWALALLEYWVVLRAVLPDAQPLWAAFMLAATLLGVAVPSLPGYVGVFEAAGVAALSVFGVPPDQGLAAALVLHGMVYSIASLIGAVALALDGETLTGLYRETRDWLATAA
jgi:glycosyltransferase 2 family protein